MVRCRLGFGRLARHLWSGEEVTLVDMGNVSAPSASPGTSHPPTAGVAVSIRLDVEQLDRSVVFYERVLDFRVVASDRVGMLLESKTLRSERFAGVEIVLRESFGKRVMGSQAGSLTAISLPVDDLEGEVTRLLGIEAGVGRDRVRWVGAVPGEAPSPDKARTSVRVLDPDAYVFELRQR